MKRERAEKISDSRFASTQTPRQQTLSAMGRTAVDFTVEFEWLGGAWNADLIGWAVRPQLTLIVAFSKRYAMGAEDVVGGDGVEMEVG